eukprot:3944689-Alexandrium_andersonii.AAC.1
MGGGRRLCPGERPDVQPVGAGRWQGHHGSIQGPTQRRTLGGCRHGRGGVEGDVPLGAQVVGEVLPVVGSPSQPPR